MQSEEQRILAWDDGSACAEPLAKITPLRSTSIPHFPANDEYEDRVDNANGSRVAIDLIEGARGGHRLLRRFSVTDKATPWEHLGFTQPIDKMRKTMGRVFGKFKGKKE